MPPRGAHQRNSHIRHLGYLFLSCSVSNLFLNSNTYLSLISLLLRRAQSWCLVVAVRVAFFRRLSRNLAVTIQ